MKIHFVCSGNTYRSRLAEAYLNSLKIPSIQATSSGVRANANLNGAITVPAKNLLEKEGLLRYTASTWTQTTRELLEKNDLVIFMEDDPYAFVRDDFHYVPPNFRVWNIPDIFGDFSTGEKIKESEMAFKEIKEKVDALVSEISTK